MRDFRTFLKDSVLVLDGAMGTMIQDLFLPDEAYGGAAFKMLSDLLVFSRPEAVCGIHLKYFQSGAHAVETNSFGATRLRLQEYDFSRLDLADFPAIPGVSDPRRLSYDEMSYHLSRRSAEIAVEAKSCYRQDTMYDGRELFVLGSIGPSNWVLSPTKANLNRGRYADIVANFRTQVLGLIDGGVDVLLFETQQDQLELKSAIHGAKQALRERGRDLPIMAQVTVDAFGKMQIFNTDILAALVTVGGLGIDVFGINCSIGPDLMLPTVRKLSQHSHLPLSVIPNAGLPVSENGKTVFKLSPEEFARTVASFVNEFGVNVVGGCCGTRPDHIRAVADAVRGLRPQRPERPSGFFVSGPQNAVSLGSTDALLRIGERLNVRGSLKVREAVEGSSTIHFDALDEVVREQVRDLGLSVIDVCMDSNLVQTEKVLCDVIYEMTTDFPGALCLDSFSVEALLAAVEVYSGRPIINSISLEEYAPGVDKIDAVVGPTKNHNPVYIALTTGPKGPAVTRDEKLDLARQIFEKCTREHGLSPDQLIFDINAFPIGSESQEGMNFAVETLRAIPLVKSLHPDVKVSLGVGNLTNGLASRPYMRQLLTSVFVHEARIHGLDAAIINPNHYVPVSSLSESDVALARRVILDRDMEAFSQLEEIALVKKGAGGGAKKSYDDLPLEENICARIRDGFKQRQTGTATLEDFRFPYQDVIVESVARALEKHAPLDFINQYLMAAMKDLGDGFGRGEVSLPHLLKSADVMKHAMGFIEAFMRHKTGADVTQSLPAKGVVVIGTVYQDVHSIGKDLVKTLLENYGYRVIDLGVQTPLEKFIETAKVHGACAIGMSALLVQTSNHMITVSRMLEDEGLSQIDVLIGGAPVNNRHAAYVGMHGQSDPAKLRPNVFYCPSGMDGVNVMNQLCESPERRKALISDNAKNLRWHYEQAVRAAARDDELLRTLPRRPVAHDPTTYTLAAQPGRRTLRLTMKELRPRLDTKTLFSLNWNYGGNKSWEKKGVTPDSLNRQLGEWIENSDREGWILPQGRIGLFPCRVAGETIILLDPESPATEIGHIAFTLQIGGKKEDLFSLAQYFASASMAYVGLQVTTSGAQVEEQIRHFKSEGDSASALLLQGLSDRVAEDMAGLAHDELKRWVGVSLKQGVRYSPGYPGLRDIHVNRTIAELLQAVPEISVALTDASEFIPTGTTAAVVCFHPQAGYE